MKTARNLMEHELVNAERFRVEPLPDDTDAAPPTTHPLAQFVEIGEGPKPPRWVIPGFIGHGAVTVAGSPGVGKTTAILPLALVAAGLHGDELMPRQWRHVVYITEDVEQVRRILAGIVGFSDLNISLESVRERLHIVEAVRLDPVYVAKVGKTYREQFTRMVDGVEVLPLVVIDTQSAVLALENENDNSEASAMMAALKQGFDGLPVWLIGHVAKANIGRSDVVTLSSRGAGSFGGDANQTLFLVQEADARYLALGKTRFEPRWRELEITSHLAETQATDEFGNAETVILRWGIATPPVQSRREAAEQAQELTRKDEAAELRDKVRSVIQVAWQAGMPLSRTGMRGKVTGKTATITSCIENLLSEGWIYEVSIPSALRTNPNKGAFLVNLDTLEHEAFMRNGVVPEAKLVIPPSWKKPPIPSVPAENEHEAKNDQKP